MSSSRSSKFNLGSSLSWSTDIEEGEKIEWKKSQQGDKTG